MKLAVKTENPMH